MLSGAAAQGARKRWRKAWVVPCAKYDRHMPSWRQQITDPLRTMLVILTLVMRFTGAASQGGCLTRLSRQGDWPGRPVGLGRLPG